MGNEAAVRKNISHDILSNPYTPLSIALGQLAPLIDSSQGTRSSLAGYTFLGRSPGAVVMHSRMLQTSDSWVVLRLGHWGPVLVREGEKYYQGKMNLPPSQSHSQLSSWWILNGILQVPRAHSSGWPCSRACAPWGPSTQRWRRVFTGAIAGVFLLHSSKNLGPTDQGPWSVLWPFSGHLISASISKMRTRSLAPWLARTMGRHSHDALPDTLLLSAGPGFGSQSKPVFPVDINSTGGTR